EGPRLRGKVLPGGGDWTLLRGDGVLELDLRLTLETDDGALIHMTSFGLRHGPPEVIAALARGEERRPLDLLLPHHPPLRDRAPKVHVLESAPRRIEWRSARRRPHLHDRRDPINLPWTLAEETFSSLPRGWRSPEAHTCPSRRPLHRTPTGKLPCDRVP